MILIDTNVISEPMKPHGDPNVVAWLDAQAAETLYISAISLSELLLGIETLPHGKRRSALATTLADQIAALFGDRILPFDLSAARVYATVVSRARKTGYAISVPDGQIAAIAETHRFAVATRDETPFRAAGLYYQSVDAPRLTNRSEPCASFSCKNESASTFTALLARRASDKARS